MPTYPNTALTQALAPFYGSCKLEISLDNGTSWTNCGLANGVTFNEVMDRSTIQADNGPDLVDYVSNHTVEISFNALEWYLPTFNKIRGGIDLLTASSAVATTDTDVYTTGSKTYAQPIYLDDCGDSSTLATITAVKSVSTGGTCTTLASTRDFITFTDANNKRGIIMVSTVYGGKFSDSQGLRVKYAFGDVATYKLTSGGLSSIASRWFRLVNKQIVSGVSKYRYLTIYSGSLNAGFNFAFKSSNDTNPILETPFSLIAKLDATRTAGDQLFMIEDEVATA